MAKNQERESDEVSRLIAHAESLARAGDWGDEAGKVNDAILKLDPENVPAHTRLARWCAERGRAQEASNCIVGYCGSTRQTASHGTNWIKSCVVGSMRG
jgi:thioredoxin-like negative regulator of GroEL